MTAGEQGRGSTLESAPDSSGAGLLRSAVRRDIVDVLADLVGAAREQGLSAQEIGDRVGLHVTTTRFHLTQLVEAGLLASHSVRTQGAGRPGKRYTVAPGSLEDVADHEAYKTLAELLTEAFATRADDGTVATPEEAGAAWARRHAPEWVHRAADTEQARNAGEWLSKVGLMIDVLREWGYTPNLATENSGRTARIDLVGCPFLPLAHANPEVVCGIHRGLMRGTLDVFGERDAELSLTPFVDPGRCRAHVTTRADFTPRGGTT